MASVEYGSLETIKPQLKNSIETENRGQNRQTDKCWHLSYQNANLSDTVVISGAYRGFAAIWDQWRRIIALQIEEKPEPNWEKPKTTSDTKSENLVSNFD